MRALMRTSVLTLLVLMAVAASVFAQDANPLFKDTRIKNYIPHMTWREVEQALTHTDMVVIPVGSNEQHGPHLPLGTDIFAAIETCKLLAQRTDILIAPVVLAGVSEHHMGFPGTIALSPETFEAVIIDTARSLIRHGFKKLMILNGHGGNLPALRAAVETINQTTSATAVLLDDLKHQRRLWVDAAYDAMGVPSEDDIAEHDYQRFVLDYGPREAFLDHVEQVDFDIEQGADR